MDVINNMNMKPDKLEIYEGRLKSLRIEVNTIKNYESKDFAKGMKETALNIARNLFNLGLPIEQVAENTGLSISVLKDLEKKSVRPLN